MKKRIKITEDTLNKLPVKQSWRKYILLGLVLIYVLSPIDIVPDFIPGGGQVDDVILVLAALARFWQLNKQDKNINTKDTVEEKLKKQPEDIVDGEIVED